MHFPTRNCTPIVLAATGRTSQRGTPSASLRKIGSAGLNSWASNGYAVSSKHIRSFSGSCLDRGLSLRACAPPVTKPRCAGLAAVPRDHLAWIQIRKFSNADHTQISGDNQKTEDLLEKFEVQEGNQEARPQRTVLSENGENGKSPTEGAKWPERMTKGQMVLLWLLQVSMLTFGNR